MKNTLKFLDNNLEKCIATVLIILMTATIFLEVIFRYCHVQAPWTEELARYMFVWMIYLGCSAAIRLRKHLKIDAVQLLFSEKVNFVLDLVQHQESPAMHLPMIIPYTSWWFCSILMVFRLIQDSIARIKERKEAVAAQRLAKGKEA